MSPSATASIPAQHCVAPYVQSADNGLSLHFTPTELQSRMSTRSPWLLDVDYTRTMMGFLLLNPAPQRIAMVGLGGGSLPKFCYRYLPHSHITVVEINPHVIALRQQFQVPDDDARFSVVQADGAVWVAEQSAVFDVLVIDGFDQDGQPAALCSQQFYDDCAQSLAPHGVLAVNLHVENPDYPVWVARLQRSFAGQTLEVLSPEKCNSIVFATHTAGLRSRAVSVACSMQALPAEAQKHLRPELARIAWQLNGQAHAELDDADLA